MSNPIEQISLTLPQILMQAVELAAADAVFIVKSRVKRGESFDGSMFTTPYSRSHKKRRQQRGLQTSVKDLHYSGTMFENLRETSRSSTASTASITVSFAGQANRRDDQRGATNQQVAEWLSDQEGKSIIGLSDNEKKQIADRLAVHLVDVIQNIQIND
jgi:hypothetical protein